MGHQAVRSFVYSFKALWQQGLQLAVLQPGLSSLEVLQSYYNIVQVPASTTGGGIMAAAKEGAHMVRVPEHMGLYT